jgi:hypothetical protein
MPEKDALKPLASTEGGALARLWRKIMTDTGMWSRSESLITQYLTRPDTDQNNNTVFDKRKNRSTIWSNIIAEDMTIKTFFDLLFNVLCIKHLRITVEITSFTNVKSSHSIDVPNPKRPPTKILTEEEKNDIRSKPKDTNKHTVDVKQPSSTK